MVCEKCVNTITNAIQAQFPEATVQANLETKQLQVEGVSTPEQIQTLIVDAGHEVAA
jgi:copper chaperone CopZ